jgi:hypothetical protein
MIRDFLKAAAQVWGEAWGHDSYMITKPVTLKALIRVCADLATQGSGPTEGRVDRGRLCKTPDFFRFLPGVFEVVEFADATKQSSTLPLWESLCTQSSQLQDG